MRTTIAARVSALGISCLLGLNSLSAADLDLDQRLANLEETAARSGNRNVSLRVYGQVNYGLMSWNDGKSADTYVVDNETSSTRLGLIGQGKVGNGTIAGYRLEMEFRGASSVQVDAKNDNFGDDQTIRLRHANWFIEDVKLGRLTVGLQSPATDDISIISLGARMSDAALHHNNAFQLQFSPAGPAGNPVFQVKWGDLAHTVDTMRGNFVRYDTPTVMGFLLSAAAGENDVWDAALRYSDGPDWLRVAGGIGFMDDGELGIRDIRGSFSASHTPTGLFATVAGGWRDDYGVIMDVPRDAYFYFLQLGLTTRYLPLGKSTIYGEYGYYNDFFVGRVVQGNLNFNGANFRRWGLLDSAVERWGVGLEQEVESTGLLFYAQFHHYSGRFFGQRCAKADPIDACTPDPNPPLPSQANLRSEPWQAFVLGARIQF